MEFLPKKALDYKYGGAGTSAFLKDQLVQVTKEGTQCGKAARVLDPAWKMTDGGLELKVQMTDGEQMKIYKAHELEALRGEVGAGAGVVGVGKARPVRPDCELCTLDTTQVRVRNLSRLFSNSFLPTLFHLLPTEIDPVPSFPNE
jgi:hypothetical protein